jgi:predicted DNA-binding protein
MSKVLFQLYIDPDQQDYIAKESEKTGRSRAAIVRDLIQKEMEKAKEATE